MNKDLKKVGGVAIGIATIVAGGILGTKGLNKEPRKYTGKWFKTVTDAILNEERENVRKQFEKSGDDFSLAVNLENLLNIFDKELSRRAWGNETPRPPRIHREHGWYISKDD